MKNDFQKEINFLYEIGCVRFIKRSWQNYLGIDFANLAEHHFRTAWIALVIAKFENAKDIEKILKMSLLHDIAESRTGDVCWHQKRYVQHFDKEAISDVFEKSILKQEMIELWREYKKAESIEAQIVADADHLDPDFELREQAIRGYQFPKKWAGVRKTVAEKTFYTKTAKKMWLEVKKSDPHAWHIRKTFGTY